MYEVYYEQDGKYCQEDDCKANHQDQVCVEGVFVATVVEKSRKGRILVISHLVSIHALFLQALHGFIECLVVYADYVEELDQEVVQVGWHVSV